MSRAATFVATTVLVLCTGALGTATAKHHARDVLKQIFSSHPAHRLGIEKPNDICDHVRNLSYPCEHLNVTTVDGFVLDVIHMAPKDPESRLAKPVIMQHGLIMTAMTFVGNNDPQLNLACILHDQGYDVFLPNARGNHYSLTNARFPERNASFWQMVDWDEMAAFDVPAVIDLALSVNGQRTKSNATQVTWVGHSEGTTVIFAALTTSATYVIPKINLFVALAPVAYAFHTTSAAFELLAKYNITNLAMDAGIYDALEDDKTIHEIVSACPDLGTLCPEALASIFGYGNLSNFAPDLYPTVTLYTPGGTSMSNLQHWSQLSTERRVPDARFRCGPKHDLLSPSDAARVQLVGLSGHGACGCVLGDRGRTRGPHRRGQAAEGAARRVRRGLGRLAELRAHGLRVGHRCCHARLPFRHRCHSQVQRRGVSWDV
jgi:pimeloyl-ACP methyl ester carboxylesterase